MPSDFNRKPRSLEKAKRLWKAHKLRQFLLYSGPVVLRNALRDDLYNHFLNLYLAITILVNPVLCKNNNYLNLSENLLKTFVKNYQILYGRENVSFNVHSLLHIVDDVRNFGPLDSYSAFRYENYIGKIKRLIRKGDKPLQQLARRLAEIRAAKNDLINEDDNCDLQLLQPHFNGPLLLVRSKSEIHQFKVLRKKMLNLKCYDDNNNNVLLINGVYIECMNFIQSNGDIYIVGKPFKTIDSFYNTSIDSSRLHIVIVDSSLNNLQLYKYEDIFAKACKIPYKKKFVMFPMMHTYDS